MAEPAKVYLCRYCAAKLPTLASAAHHEEHLCDAAKDALEADIKSELLRDICDTFPDETSPALVRKIAQYLIELGVTEPNYD